MSTILLTGGTGLLGRAVLRAGGAGASWVLAVRDASRAPSAPQIRPWVVDLAAPWDARALPERIDAVIHLAQEENYRGFPESAGAMFEVNLASTNRLLDYARRAGARRFIFASSGGIYGTSEAPLSETSLIQIEGPLAYYLATKRAAELLVEPYSRYFGVSIFRIFFAYGPGQKPGFLMPNLVRSVRAGRPLSLAGPEGIRLNPIHADDAGRVLFAAANASHPGLEVLNLAGPEVLSLRQIGEEIGRALGVAPAFAVDLEKVPGHVVANTDRLQARYPAPQLRFREGLAAWLATDPPELR
ncbi:MAG: SDR family oxidoreductase [Myxococcota bacterium]